MNSSRFLFTFVCIAITTIWLSGCDKQQSDGISPTSKSSAPFVKEKFLTYDSLKTIDFVSADECEMSSNGKILLCKYSKNEGGFRVVIPSLGGNEVIYFQIVAEGIKSENQPTYYSLAQHAVAHKKAVEEVKKSQELAAEAARKAQELLAAEIRNEQERVTASETRSKILHEFDLKKVNIGGNGKTINYDIKVDQTMKVFLSDCDIELKVSPDPDRISRVFKFRSLYFIYMQPDFLNFRNYGDMHFKPATLYDKETAFGEYQDFSAELASPNTKWELDVYNTLLAWRKKHPSVKSAEKLIQSKTLFGEPSYGVVGERTLK